MIAYDGTIRIGTSYTGPSQDDVDQMMREMAAAGVGPVGLD